jgi:hypothetical protein
MNNIGINDLETHLLECYLFVDDYLQSHPKVAGWRRSMGSDPDFTDAEVIALMQGYFRTNTLKRTYELVVANAEKAFPRPRKLQTVDSSPEAALGSGWPAGLGRCSARTRRRGQEALRGGLAADSSV